MTHNVVPLTQLRVILLSDVDEIVFDRKMAVADTPTGVVKYLNNYYTFIRVDFVTESIIYRETSLTVLIP